MLLSGVGVGVGDLSHGTIRPLQPMNLEDVGQGVDIYSVFLSVLH